MSRTRFAQMLSTRRKQLRLSIPQAAKVLRMRESVLVAFEEGDFENLPALGYAQAMVASYARYLGLDSREICELYEREHEQYVSEVTGHDLSGLARLSDEPSYRGPTSGVSAPRPSRPQVQALPAARGTGGVNLPTEGLGRSNPGSWGYASDAARARRDDGLGRYAPQGSQQGTVRDGYYSESSADETSMLSRGRSRSSARRDAYREPYSDERSHRERRDGRSASASERRYTTRMPERDEDELRRRQASARRARSTSSDRRGSWGEAERTGDITLRHVSSGQYRDDMRYDDDSVRSYRPSSTRAGRAGVTRNSTPPERPNVRRRSTPASGRDPRSRRSRREPEPKGITGAISSFFSDPRRAMLLIGMGLAIVLALILVFSIRSCASGSESARQVPVVTSAAAASTEATTVSEAEQQALSDAAAKAAASEAAAATQETIVTVSVADGATSWVEIVCDGEQKVAESLTGEWSESYTVTQSIDIKVGDPSSVTVEKNGERQQLSSKSAGVSSITIQGTDVSASTTDEATTSESSDGSSEDGSDGSSDESYDDSYDEYSDEYYDESYDEESSY